MNWFGFVRWINLLMILQTFGLQIKSSHVCEIIIIFIYGKMLCTTVSMS